MPAARVGKTCPAKPTGEGGCPCDQAYVRPIRVRRILENCVKYQAVVFDLDGTLLDTLEDLADSMNAALAARGLPTHPTEAYKTFVGDGMHNLVYRTAPASRDDAVLHAELLEAARAEYGRRWANKTRPYDGVRELLDGLSARGCQTAVLTNKPQDFAELCVDRLLAGWRFDAVQGVDDGVPPKPDPTGAYRVCTALGLQPGDCLYLGDTNTDMRTAVGVGMYPVGAIWGFRTAEELRQTGAAALAEHPTDVLTML